MDTEAFALDPKSGQIHTSQESIDDHNISVTTLIKLTASQAKAVSSVAPSRRAALARRLIKQAKAEAKSASAYK